jgi:hypothetical protein
MQTRAETIRPNTSAPLISALSRRRAQAAQRTSALRGIWLQRPWTDRGPCGIKRPFRKRPCPYRCCEDRPLQLQSVGAVPEQYQGSGHAARIDGLGSLEPAGWAEQSVALVVETMAVQLDPQPFGGPVRLLHPSQPAQIEAVLGPRYGRGRQDRVEICPPDIKIS